MIDPTDPDRLHHSDWSAVRVGQALRDAIADGVTRAAQTTPA
jgi:hypothetical protein